MAELSSFSNHPEGPVVEAQDSPSKLATSTDSYVTQEPRVMEPVSKGVVAEIKVFASPASEPLQPVTFSSETLLAAHPNTPEGYQTLSQQLAQAREG